MMNKSLTSEQQYLYKLVRTFSLSYRLNNILMQIELLLQNHLQKSTSIQTLSQQLQNKTQACLQKATSHKQKIKCNQDLNHYHQYLKAYSKQFAEKGQNMCLNSLNAQTLLERQQQRNSCVDFYMKGLGVLEENVKDKLHSLLYKLDYSEL